MATNVIMPALGVAQQTGTLLKWLKAEGQSVSKGEPLMEIETDKATVEIEAPGSGVLANVTASPGDEIPVGNRIALILAPGEAASATASESLHPSPVRKGEGTKDGRAAPRGKQAAVKPPLPQGEGRGEGASTTTPSLHTSRAVSISSSPGRLLASPAARRIAREKGIDLTSLKGSGPEGSILAEDVLRAAPDGAPQTRCERATNPTVEPDAPHRRRAHDSQQTERAAFLLKHGNRHERGEQAADRLEGTRSRCAIDQ